LHGRHVHRQIPPDAHRTLDAGLPAACPCCGGALDETGIADQYQTDPSPGAGAGRDQIPGPDRAMP
jgi:hypothetical protein